MSSRIVVVESESAGVTGKRERDLSRVREQPAIALFALFFPLCSVLPPYLQKREMSQRSFVIYQVRDWLLCHRNNSVTLRKKHPSLIICSLLVDSHARHYITKSLVFRYIPKEGMRFRSPPSRSQRLITRSSHIISCLHLHKNPHSS